MSDPVIDVTPPVDGESGNTVITGIGIDVVSVDRFAAALQRSSGLGERLFTPAERTTPAGTPRRPASLAARFAAKEAVAKALGVPRGMQWHDCEISAPDGRRPAVVIRGTVAAQALAQGIRGFEVSLSHDAGIAAAIVVALR